MRFMAIFAGVVAMAAIAVGCGGSSDSKPLSKAEFKKQAEALCEKGEKEAQADFAVAMKRAENLKDSRSNEEKASDLGEDVVIPYLRNKLEGLEELGSPSSGQKQISAWLEELSAGVEELEEKPEQAVEGNPPLVKASEMVTEYGIKACA